MLRAACLGALAAVASSHGAMTFPKPRQAVDGALLPWSNWSWAPHAAGKKYEAFNNGEGACPHAAKNGVKNALNGSNGQACYWFSNGCTIGCGVCAPRRPPPAACPYTQPHTRAQAS